MLELTQQSSCGWADGRPPAERCGRCCAQEGEDTAAVSREMITEGLGGADAGIAFIDYGRGAPEGHLRFKTPELAQKALEGVGEDKEKLLGTPRRPPGIMIHQPAAPPTHEPDRQRRAQWVPLLSQWKPPLGVRI